MSFSEQHLQLLQPQLPEDNSSHGDLANLIHHLLGPGLVSLEVVPLTSEDIEILSALDLIGTQQFLSEHL
jgi:hypothetical protein